MRRTFDDNNNADIVDLADNDEIVIILLMFILY